MIDHLTFEFDEGFHNGSEYSYLSTTHPSGWWAQRLRLAFRDCLLWFSAHGDDAEENKVCSFDEPSTPLQGAALLDFFRQRSHTSIQCAQLDDFEGPDAVVYDPVDHKIFVSDPGSPPDDCDPKLPLAQHDCVAKVHGQVINFKGKTIPTLNARVLSQNISVVDALHPTQVITKIAVGTLTVTASERTSMESIAADAPGKVNILQGNIAEFG